MSADRNLSTGDYNSAPPSQSDVRPSEHIGPYKLLDQLGHGGMGEVWLAEQSEPVRRRVALKLIKAGMDTQQVLARFEAERQALALMDHANIAKVLDAGRTDAGRPYFVMELVKGTPLTTFCDAEKLSLRERLELFIPICQAVQHAHQKGIIHRDLKPSNILVSLIDGRPVPKVIDFGVAKAISQKLTERTLYTAIGMMVGTPEYMAPEQAEVNNVDIDTRADIYSLGVVLYELLAGSPPFAANQLRGAAFDEMLRVIREVEPPKPSTKLSSSDELPNIAARRKVEPHRLTKSVQGDLDWIVMKCLEKERARRYDTANGLAMDIQRYLSDEPVLAGPPSTGYRFKKFVRRNRGMVLAVGIVAATLVTGIIGTSAGLLEARRENERANKANYELSVERQLSENRRWAAQTREAETKAVLEFVENQIFAAARPQNLGRKVTLREAVEAALPKVAEGFPEQPLIEARLRMTLGTSFWYLGEPAIAEEQFRRSRELCAARFGRDHPETLRSINNLATSFQNLGRHPEALALHEETLSLQKARLGPDHADTLNSMNNLANSYYALGRHSEALALHEEALKLRKAKFGHDHPDTLASMHNLAISRYTLGQHSEALELCKETLKLYQAKLGVDHPDTVRCMHSLANSHDALGQQPEALALREETVKIQKAKLGPDHQDTLLSLNNLASSYADLNRHNEALTLREETLKLYKAKFGPSHPETLMSMNNLSASYYALDRHPQALALREETLKLYKAKLGPDHQDTLVSMNNLAESYCALDRANEALPLLADAVRRADGKPGLNPQLIPSLIDQRMRIFEKRRDAVGCKATAELWENLKRTDAASLYQAGCNRAVSAAVIREGKGPDADEQADQAMAWLKQAIAAGYKEFGHMKKDKDLDAIRDREDFKKLLAELEEKAKQPAAKPANAPKPQ